MTASIQRASAYIEAGRLPPREDTDGVSAPSVCSRADSRLQRGFSTGRPCGRVRECGWIKVGQRGPVDPGGGLACTLRRALGGPDGHIVVQHPVDRVQRRQPIQQPGLDRRPSNAVTSLGERTFSKIRSRGQRVEGYRIERPLMDCFVHHLERGDDAIYQYVLAHRFSVGGV